MAGLRKTALSLFIVIVAQCMLPTGAFAIAHPDAQHASLNANAWQPGISGTSLLFTESPQVIDHLALRGFFATQLIHRPWVIRRSADHDLYRSLVAYRPEIDLGFAIGLWGFLETGLFLPVVLGQHGEYIGRKMGDVAAYGVGDISWYIKGQILRQGKNAPFNLGISALLWLPSGNHNAYMGYSTVAGETKILVSYTLFDVTVGTSVGVLLQPKTSLYDAVDTHKIRSALGVSYAIKPFRTRVGTEVLYSTQWQRTPREAYAASVQMLGNVAFDASPAVTVLASAGAGLMRGMGTPDYRVLLGVNVAYDDYSDADLDGIPRKRDQCPQAREDKDDFEDEDGCPDVDNDQDGILDTADACPMQPEDKDDFEDTDGCPETDNDQDGLEDAVDACPNAAEDRNGIEDDDGCPETEPQIEEDDNGTVYIAIENAVFFEFGKAKLRPAAHRMLNRIMRAVRNYPRFSTLRIEGFTDNIGSKAYNIRLSQRRAEAVRRYFVNQGMPAHQLEALGRGMAQPRARNASTKGRQINRRVEFVIIADQAPPVDPDAGVPSTDPDTSTPSE